MERSNSTSPVPINCKNSRSSSIDDVLIPAITNEFPKIECFITNKTCNSELINKFLIMPDDILTINFDVLKMDDSFILRNIVCYIFKSFFDKMNYHKINAIRLKGFVKDVCDNYNSVPYHNFYHATHILHTTYLLLNSCDLFNKLKPDISFAVLIASLVHDIGHPGNNNLFEINTCSELACRYNDLSVLEQYHCHLAFELIKKHNIFENFSNKEFIICRKTIINSILGTDMANHKSIIETMKLKIDEGFNFDSIDDQYLLAKIFLHAADIGNPIQSFGQCENWARRVFNEFFTQIEKEKQIGLQPFASFNINSTLSFYIHEMKYIKYICKPYWEILTTLFNNLMPFYEQINNNYDRYTFIKSELENQYDSKLGEF